MKLKDQLELFINTFLIYRKGRFIFTEHIKLCHDEYGAKNNWKFNKSLDKGYFIRKLLETLREMYKIQHPELMDELDFRVKACHGMSAQRFAEIFGYSSKILVDFDWKDPQMSSHCYDGPLLIESYVDKKAMFPKKTPSQYFHPEFPHTDILTYNGVEAIIQRYKNINYDIENYNHNKNLVQLMIGALYHAKEANRKSDNYQKEIALLKKRLDLLENKKN